MLSPRAAREGLKTARNKLENQWEVGLRDINHLQGAIQQMIRKLVENLVRDEDNYKEVEAIYREAYLEEDPGKNYWVLFDEHDYETVTWHEVLRSADEIGYELATNFAKRELKATQAGLIHACGEFGKYVVVNFCYNALYVRKNVDMH